MKLLVCLENSGLVKEVKVNLATGDHKLKDVGFNGSAVHVSKVIYDQRQYVALGRRDGSVEVLDVEMGTPRRLYPAQREVFHPSELFASIDYAHKLLYTCTTGGMVTVRECKLDEAQTNDELISTHNLGDAVSVLRPHPTQRGVVAFGGPQRVLEVAIIRTNRRNLWRSSKEEYIWISDVRFTNVRGTSESAEPGYSLVAVSRYGDAYIYHTNVSARPVRKIQVGDYPLTHLHMNHSLGGDAFYVANSQNQVSLVGYDGQVRHKVCMPGGSVFLADFFSPATRQDPREPLTEPIPSTSISRGDNIQSALWGEMLMRRRQHTRQQLRNQNQSTDPDPEADPTDHYVLNDDAHSDEAPRRPPFDRRYFERVLGLSRPRIQITTGGEDRARREASRELRREERRLRMIRADTGNLAYSSFGQGPLVRRVQRWSPLTLARDLQSIRRPEASTGQAWTRDSDDLIANTSASLRASRDSDYFRELWCDDDEQSLMYFNTLSSVHLPNEAEEEEEDDEEEDEDDDEEEDEEELTVRESDTEELFTPGILGGSSEIVDRFMPPHLQSSRTTAPLQPSTGRFVGGVQYESRASGLDLTVVAGLDRHVRVFDISQPSIASQGRLLFDVAFESRITSVAILEVNEEDICEKTKRAASPVSRDTKRQRV
ncbi:hypothetical protein CJU90_0108 [Yarrowia sp. C11]|nr:hypothetical protein CKK34_1519 [Yarrowia sp. E02]KAG5372469.1 hypothetical protein CJU90_0108 [Yarrowia sp. C11]